jgi:hypothetical protein
MIRPEIPQSVFHGRNSPEHTKQNLLCFGLACKTELIETIRTGKAQDINGQGRLLFNIVQDEISGAVPAVNGVVKIKYVHCLDKCGSEFSGADNGGGTCHKHMI